MFAKKIIVTSILSVATMALPAFCQSENPEKNEVSVQAFGSFVKSTNDNGVENSASNKVAGLKIKHEPRNWKP